MLPLVGENFPTTTDELTAQLRRGLETEGASPKALVGEGGAYPQVATLSIDLTGTQLTRDTRLRAVTGASAAALEIGHFEIFGKPLYFEKAPVEARLEAYGAKMAITGEAGNSTLVLKDASSGNVSVQVAIEDLEKLLHSVVTAAAGKQGIEIKKTTLSVTPEGPRAVSLRVEATAKVFVMTAKLAVLGRLEIDNDFYAKLSALSLDGDAMVTNLAGSFLRPRLQQLEGRVFPLMAFLPAGIILRDIEVSASPNLHVQARFGGAA